MNATPTIEEIRTTCAIVGGGPAGMMLGFLLARAGVKVLVLEKHQDFLRDFRGDTIHPSTLELMHELGLLQEFLKLPHRELRHISAVIGATNVQIGDFTHLPTQCRYIALMPQRDFLNFLAEQGARYPAFDLRMKAEVTELIEQDGRCVGLRAKTPTGGLASRPHLWSAPTGDIRPCASAPALSSTISVRRSTSCGCACRASQAMAIRSCASASARRS